MKTAVHNNSLEAYRQGQIKLHSRAKKILDFLRYIDEPLTDRQVQRMMGFAERGDVQPRISDLIRFGLAREAGKIKCDVTGKRVRRVKAVKIQTQGDLFE